MIEIQKLILSDGLGAITQRNIKVVDSVKYPGLKLFKYHMIDSPMSDQVVRQARGIILDANNNYEPVCRPFDKFFNYNEPLAAKLDFNTQTRVETKVDGSLCSMYFYGGRWNVATSGHPDAAGRVDQNNFTFAELFWRIFELYKPLPTDQITTQYTFMFEMTAPYNQIIVRQHKLDLTLIGIRHTKTGIEVDPHTSMLKCGFRTAGRASGIEASLGANLDPYEVISAKANSLSPMDNEGYVVVDGHFNRVKIKSDAYVRLHALLGNKKPSTASLIDVVKAGEQSEVAAYLPVLAQRLSVIHTQITSLITSSHDKYSEIYQSAFKLPLGSSLDMAKRKDFALAANETPFPGILFAILRINPPVDKLYETIRSYIYGSDAKQLERLIDDCNRTS